jgi:hypothetical protein
VGRRHQIGEINWTAMRSPAAWYWATSAPRHFLVGAADYAFHMAQPAASRPYGRKQEGTMNLRLRIAAAVMLLGAIAVVLPEQISAQEIDFGKVDKFESLASGTLHVGAPPKTIVDDGERHVVILTIWDADAETKVYWRSSDGNAPRTTTIPGRGVQTFQTLGEFKLEAVGEPNHEVQYGYVILVFGNEAKSSRPATTTVGSATNPIR